MVQNTHFIVGSSTPHAAPRLPQGLLLGMPTCFGRCLSITTRSVYITFYGCFVGILPVVSTPLQGRLVPRWLVGAQLLCQGLRQTTRSRPTLRWIGFTDATHSSR